MLTDNGTHLTTPKNKRSVAAEIPVAIKANGILRAHPFELACAQIDIDHRLTKPCNS